MDFERAAIKALFYDYPIEEAVRALDVSKGHLKDVYTDILPQLVRWREQAFTMTEADLIRELTTQDWMYPQGSSSSRIFALYRPFFVLQIISKRLLEEDETNPKHYPIVKFDYLLRWKDVTAFVGEDLLTTAFKAEMDIEHQKVNCDFLWEDYIHHTQQDINRILSRGLSDIHAHGTATTDVFHLNWVNLMNNPQRRWMCAGIKQFQDLSVNTPTMESLYKLERLCVAAAYLRLRLYRTFVLNDSLASQELPLWRVESILLDDLSAMLAQKDILSIIGRLRRKSPRTLKRQAIDYAIRLSSINGADIDNIFLVYQGERQLLYSYFSELFVGGERALELAPYAYLYVLIKNHIRREFVQINSLKGFKNFSDYQDRKDIFVKEGDPIANNWNKYVAQTTLRTTKDKMELRYSPKTLLSQIEMDYSHSVFTNKLKVPSVKTKVGMIAHFIKDGQKDTNKTDFECRYSKYREKIKKEFMDVLKAYDKQHPSKTALFVEHDYTLPILGIDAAATEMFCRPEVFGHIFRYADRKGIYNRTYHVGEDFFDIVDGLRAIDEAIMFLELDSHCRIGHALAMGIDAAKYYEKRRYNVIMPKQNFLDNCVWLYKRASENSVPLPHAMANYLESTARRMFMDIGYYKKDGVQFDIDHYWNSMLLRGDEPLFLDWDETKMCGRGVSEWKATACVVDSKENREALKDSIARTWFYSYQYSAMIREKGNENVQGEIWQAGIENLVKRMQEVMRKKVAEKDITVECNPTSNLKIGHFDRYDEHPLLTVFDPIKEKDNTKYPVVKATINTDDRGVFATSLYNEFSLMALAMLKQKDNKHELVYRNHRAVYDYIDRIRLNGQQQRFK